MTFVSFAQNYEDVMLDRALKEVDNGFYIDVGACSPDEDSVTRAFYEAGWSGINIEPNPEFYQQLIEKRPNDINLQKAAGDKKCTLTLNILEGTGLSTLDSNIAEMHAEKFPASHVLEVDVVTLQSIWETFVPPDQPVHFLKIDVEGFEKNVLKGLNWKKNRAWIIVVEATRPMSQQQNHETWEEQLLNNKYIHAYSDGLNRFYVAQEKKELLDAFQFPPCVFDGFIIANHAALQNEISTLNNQVIFLNEQIVNHEVSLKKEMRNARISNIKVQEFAAKIEELDRLVHSIYASKSWKFSSPLRVGLNIIRRISNKLKRV